MSHVPENIVDQYPVPHLERLVGDDNRSTKEVREEILRGKGDGNADDSCAGNKRCNINIDRVRM